MAVEQFTESLTLKEMKCAKRGGANVKVLSALFFVVFLGENLAFALVGFATAPYVIVTGILLLVYAAAFYGTAKAVKSM